jgi:hypothetical protein
VSDVALLDTAVVAHRLSELRLAPRHLHKALTLWPLLPLDDTPSAPPGYRLLEQALDDGVAGVAEPVGSPELHVRVDNRAGLPLLVLGGEELGGRSAGVCAAASALVPTRSHACIPVRELDARQSRMHREHGHQLRELPVLPGQLGLAVSMGDRLLGVELMSCPHAFRRALPGLAAALWLRALELAFRCGTGADARRPRFDAPEPFLEALSKAATRVAPTPGIGRCLELEGSGVVGRALLAQGTLVHLTARPLDTLHPTARSGRRRPGS